MPMEDASWRSWHELQEPKERGVCRKEKKGGGLERRLGWNEGEGGEIGCNRGDCPSKQALKCEGGSQVWGLNWCPP